jgi:hypothetical protein
MSTPEDPSPSTVTPPAPEGTRPASEAELRDLAFRRLKKRQDFRAHLVVYVVVNGFLWLLWALTSSDAFPWPIFVTLGWGIGVVMNAWDVYGRRDITAADVDREVAKLRGS